MLSRIPHLHQFSRLYWNQMGGDVYGSIETAFRQFLADAARLPVQGKALRRALYGELMLISDNDYALWVQAHRTDVDAVRRVGGRFIQPAQLPSLLSILEDDMVQDA